MQDTQAIIEQVYAAFNDRDTDGALALMGDSVNWPKASEGGRVVGKEEIRSYWARQWKEFNPHVEPVQIQSRADGTVEVRVHQVVRSLAGDLLSDSEVFHLYTIANGLIQRMDVREGDSAASDSAPSAAFSRH